jgi:hypothetical protein
VSDQEKRLSALLDDLENGRISLAEACAQVRGMNWPRAAGKTAFQTRLADAIGQLGELPPPGSFGEVNSAFHSGRVDYRQYEQLHAAYEAASGDHPQRDPGGAEPQRP